MTGVLAAIAAINVLTYFGKKLYFSIFVGILLVALFNRFPLYQSSVLFFTSVTSSISINMALIIITLTAFGSLLKETGNLEKIVETISLILTDRRHQVIVLPAMVGLLTFPGGAIFSAPLVKEAGSDLDIDNTNLAISNIMFRHLLYLIYPFYPAILLMAEISTIDVMHIVYLNLLIFLIFFMVVFTYIFKSINCLGKCEIRVRDLPALLHSLFPIIVIFLIAITLKLYFPLAIVAGILTAVFNYLPKDISITESLKGRAISLWDGINWQMALTIVLLLVLKDFLDQSGSVEELAVFLLDKGLSLVMLAVIIPYFVGFITGSHMASLSISIPLFLAVMPLAKIQGYFLSVVFISSLVGYVGSPLHMCTVLTAEYFDVPVWSVVKKINLLGLFLIMLSIIFYLILK